ncbi:hypothetical protein AB0I28_11770 [Phytomonospora sp. NPDC050363]|uniref:TPR repeat region-containing protein n=1 Tax=Phytomonospora sp. NPDC050363 TaxID=3155642 RepID=UPI0033F7A50C
MAWDASPWETKAKEDVIRAQSEQFHGLAGRITGRGTNLKGTIDKGAMEYSSLVADPIESVNGDNMKVWQEGTQASFFGGTVLGAWATEIGTLKDGLEALENRYKSELNRIYAIGTGSPTAGDANTGRLAQQEELERELTREATRLKATFDADTEKRGGQMANGATPAVLKELVTEGDMGWAAWNLWGAKAPVPLGAKDGDAIAKMLAKLKNGERLTNADRELLIQLNALVGHAAWLQKNGGDLTKGELGYLKALYGGLDGKREFVDPTSPRNVATGLLFSVDEFLTKGNYSESDADLIRGGLGGGLLALSDEGIGGGFEMLPKDIQDIVNKEIDSDIQDNRNHTPTEWEETWGKLAPLLGAAPLAVKGGMEFSAKTTIRMAEYTRYVGGEKIVGQMQDLLKVSTRNWEANRQVLTGGYQNEKYGADTPEFVLRELFGRDDWTDKGEAAASLIDWIPEAAKSGDSYDRHLAGYSAAALIDITTNTQKSEHWDETAFQFFTDAGGEMGDDKLAPVGQRNPLIAQAMGDVAGTYLDSWGELDPGKELTTEWSQGHLSVDHSDRSRFFQLVAGDPVARGKLGDDILAQLAVNAEDMVRAGEGAEADGLRGQLRDANGMLLGYYNHAVENNMFDQVAGVEKGQQDEYAEKAAAHARNDAIAAGLLGGAGTAVNSGIGVYNDYHPAPGTPAVRTPWGYVWRVVPSLAQTALGFPVSEINQAPDAYDPNDVAYKNVESINYKQMSMLTNQAMVNAALDTGKIDMADLPEGLRSEGNSVRSFDRDDMLNASAVNGQLEGVLKRAGYDWVGDAHSNTYQTYDDLFDDRESYEDYLQHRNDPEVGKDKD